MSLSLGNDFITQVMQVVDILLVFTTSTDHESLLDGETTSALTGFEENVDHCFDEGVHCFFVEGVEPVWFCGLVELVVEVVDWLNGLDGL